jgi:2-dehydro-3-deoxygluconokinase
VIDVVTFGEALVSLRSTAPLATGASLSMHVAGAESNVAVGLARLGHRVAWVGRVGDDELGEFVRRTLRAEAVIDGIVIDPRRPTAVMFLEQRTADVTRVRYYRTGSAGSALDIDDVRPHLEARTRLVHVSGITPALSESARAAVDWAVEAAAAAGIAVCLDVNYRGRLWSRDDARAALAPIAARASVVVASADELDLLGAPGEDEVAVAAGLLDRGCDEVLVKLGAEGARSYRADGVRTSAAVSVRAIDTVGAGDAFTAGYLSGWLDGLGPLDRLRRAVTLGAFAVATRGDWEGLPQRSELALLDHFSPGTTQR